MKIAYPGLPVFHGESLYDYPRQIAEGMMEHYASNDYLLYCTDRPSGAAAERILSRTNCALRMPARYYANPKAAWRVWGMTGQLRADRPDLYHGLNGTLPLNFSKRDAVAVVTIHDLSWLSYPKLFNPLERRLRRARTAAAVARADKVIAVSHFVAGQLTKEMGVDKEKIDVIYPAVGEMFSIRPQENTLQAVAARYRLPERFIVAPEGPDDIHNPELIIRALTMTRAQDVHVVITGGNKPERRELRRRAREEGVSGRIHLTGPVSDITLSALYALADAAVAPGFYSAFPMRVAQAMKAGTPVICSNTGAYAEITADAAIQIYPEDVRSLSEAFGTIAARTADTQTMAARARESASHFDLHQMIDSTFFTYLAALDQ